MFGHHDIDPLVARVQDTVSESRLIIARQKLWQLRAIANLDDSHPDVVRAKKELADAEAEHRAPQPPDGNSA